MKSVVLFNLLFLLGLSQAQYEISEDIGFSQAQYGISEDTVLRRIARAASSNAAEAARSNVGRIIMENCILNGHFDAAVQLYITFDKMNVCLRRKRIYLTPREEYLAFIEECRRESVKQSKACLKESQQYFPEIQLEASKALTNMLYDNYDIVKGELAKCLPRLKDDAVTAKHKQCLKTVIETTNKPDGIPQTKEEFCRSYIPLAYCYTDMIKENCDDTPGLAKYRKDYVNFHKQLCEDNKVL